MNLVLVNGLPASGKSTFSTYLAEALGCPAISKDFFKEIIGSQLDSMNLDDSRWAGKTSYSLLVGTVELLLGSGVSCIAESCFREEDDQIFQKICKKTDAKAFQVNLIADGHTLFERFKRRHLIGERPRIHLENFLSMDSFQETLLSGKNITLPTIPVIAEIDTTDITSINWDEHIERVIAAVSMTE